VFGVAKPELLTPAIQQVYSADSFNVGPGQWFVADSGTAKEVSDKLGITDGALGAAVVVSAAGYFGRYQANLWEWLAAEMRATPNG
jgi:hypothetical protein